MPKTKTIWYPAWAGGSVVSRMVLRLRRADEVSRIYREAVPNKNGEYTRQERAAYEPERCSQCGSRQIVQKWHHTNVNDPGEPRYMPGLTECTNDQCPRNTG
jgi:hypothetical protein